MNPFNFHIFDSGHISDGGLRNISLSLAYHPAEMLGWNPDSLPATS